MRWEERSSIRLFALFGVFHLFALRVKGLNNNGFCFQYIRSACKISR